MRIVAPSCLAFLACLGVGGCATEAPEGKAQQAADGQRFTNTGTAIPRKKGQGTGAAQVGAADTTDLENARVMMAHGLRKF